MRRTPQEPATVAAANVPERVPDPRKLTREHDDITTCLDADSPNTNALGDHQDEPTVR